MAYDEERDEERRSFHRLTRDLDFPDGLSAPPDEPLPPAGPDPRDYAVCIERTISDGVEILIYQRRS